MNAAKARPRRRRWHAAMRDHASARCVVEAGARAAGARVDSQNGCQHFQWWFRARIGMTRGLGHVDSAPLKVVAPMKSCRSRVVPRSRCALVTAEGEARVGAFAMHARGSRRSGDRSDNRCHHFQWWFRARIGTARGLVHFDSAPLPVVVSRANRHGARACALRLRTTQSGGTHEGLSQSGGSALALRARHRLMSLTPPSPSSSPTPCVPRDPGNCPSPW